MTTTPTQKIRRRWPGSLATASIVFLVAASVAALLLWRLEQYRLEEVRSDVARTAADHAFTLQRHLEQAFSASYALAALVRQGNGTVSNFQAIAGDLLPFYPGVAALELAPGGIVRSVVPLAGNEGALGHNLLKDPTRNTEAILARDTGKLTLAGPFALVQGGLGAVARLPVYLPDGKGGKSFWGFTAVLVRFPETLAPARLPQLATDGVIYELWRVDPGTGKRQVIAASSSSPLTDPVEQPLDLPNGTWTLSVAPVKGWGDPLGLSLKALLGLLFSLLLAWLAKLLIESKRQEAELEGLVAQRTAEYRESEERLRLLGDNLPSSYIYRVLHDDGTPRFLHLSAGVEKVHGVKRDDVLRDAGILYGHIDPEQLPLLKAEEEASKREMADFHIELRMRRPDGACRWLQLRSRPRRRPDGQVFWDGVATDITAEKKVEEALRHERDFSNALLNALPCVFYLFDDHLKFLRWNKNVEEVLGYTPEELKGRSLLDFFDGEDKTLVAKRIREAFEKGTAEVEAHLVARDGTSRPHFFTAVKATIAAKDCLLGVGIDITGIKKVEAALERARVEAVQEKSYVEGMMEALPVGVAISNIDGEYVRINSMFKELWAGLGPTPPTFSEFSNYKAWFIESGKPVQPEEWASARALRNGEKTVGQLLKIERFDGTEAYVHNSAAPLHDAEGRVAGCAVAVMDVTEQVHTKESLRVAKEAAEAANTAKTDFLANMSHELRTPMTAILGMLQLVLEEDLAPRTREYLETIQSSARSLLRVLNDILDMTNLAAGKMSIIHEIFSLPRCVSEAFDIFSLEARRKGVDAALSVDPEVPESVLGDHVRLRQVLINLVGNAVKFTPAEGTITVGTAECTVDDVGSAEVYVSDTGPGIAEPDQKSIFEAYFRSERTAGAAGVGLGLAISDALVRQMGGVMHVRSRLGEGARFSIRLRRLAQ